MTSKEPTAAKSKKNKIVIFVSAILLIISGVLFYLNFKKPIKNELKLFGNIEIRQVDLSFRVSGRLKNVYFEEGDYVKKGEILAKLDEDTFKASLNEARAKVADTYAIKINSFDMYRRNLALCRDGTVSKQECKNLLTNKNKGAAEYDLAKAQLENARINLNDTVLKAPNDGIILTRIIEPGSIISSGMPVYSLSLFKPLWARAYIPEEDLGKIKPGQRAYISNDSMPNKEFSAHIGFISPVAEFTPKTVETVSLRTDLVYRLRVIIDDEDKDLNFYLRQGMPVNIRIPLENSVARGKTEDLDAAGIE